MRIVALSLLISLSLLGCTAQPVQPLYSQIDRSAVQLQNVTEVPISPQRITGDHVICDDVVPTGSHIPRRRCQTLRQRDREAADSQEWLASKGRSGSPVLADPVSY